MGEVVYGPGHVRSTLGILKLLEILFCLIAVILVSVNGWSDNLIKAFYAGTIIGIILSLLICVLSATEAGHSINGALKYQCFVHCVLFLYILIVSAVLVARFYSRTHRAGGVFGLISALAYLIDALVSFKAYGIRVM